MNHTGTSSQKRQICDPLDVSQKLLKPVVRTVDETEIQDYQNFKTACLQVSSRSYFDYSSRFLLDYLPACVMACKHQDKIAGDNLTGDIRKTPSYIEESFNTEIRNKTWYEALEVCHISITTTQYLSSDILKNIVEIMLNAHEDNYFEYPVVNLIAKCQQILSENFKRHSPCLDKNLRDCYQNFLTSPMFLQKKSFTNRKDYGSNKGIIKYCMKRLHQELKAQSKDGPIVTQSIPEDITDTIRACHWQREKLEIFETLDRNQRIERLFAVLESLIELFQIDLIIATSRSSNVEGRLTRSQSSYSSLMKYVLSENSDLKVTRDCLEILEIFTCVVHLQYPKRMIKIISTWVNTIIQTFYIREAKSNSDYPNTSQYCKELIDKFYKIISDKPHNTIIRILEYIEPPFMRHLVGLTHLHKILSVNEACIIKILISFIKQRHWKYYVIDRRNWVVTLLYPPTKIDDKINYVLQKHVLQNTDSIKIAPGYGKMPEKMEKISQELPVIILYKSYT